MPTPSIVIVPARLKAATLFSQIPLTGEADLSLVQASGNATRVNASGFIEVNPINVPRLDYRNLVGAVDCPALLVEPAGENLATRSNELSTSPNIVDASTTTGTPFISPDGTSNAIRFIETTASDRHGFYQYNQSSLVAQAYTISVFTKQTGRRYIAFTSDYTGTAASTYFDLQTATTVSVGSGWTARIEPYLDGWYRLSCTATAVSGYANSRYVIWGGSVNGTSNSYTGSTSISNTFYGLQVETGSVATSYIPTTTASATRGADNYSVSGAVSGFIGLTSGAIYAEVDVRNWEASGRVVALSDGTSDGSIVIMENANRSFSLSVTSAGFSTVSITTASGLYNGLHRIAVAYKKDDYAVYLNGQLVGTNTTAGVPSVNRIFIGKIESSGTTNYFNDRIRAIAFYNTRPTNSELATLTQVDYTNLVWDTYTSRTSLSTELPECLFVRHIELLNI